MNFLNFKFNSFTAVSAAYGQFQAPTMKLVVGNTIMEILASEMLSKITGGGMMVDGVTINLNRNSASSASFRIVDAYNVETKRFNKNIAVGMKISIFLGYGMIMKKVFSGYIENISYEFSGQPAINVQAFDVVQLMISGGDKSVTWEAGERYSDTIKKIMNNYSMCSFSALNILPVLSTHGQIRQSTDDYHFIKNQLCKMCDRDFIVSGGSGYLVNAYTKFGKVIDLGYGAGLTSINIENSYKNYEVKVTGDAFTNAKATYSDHSGVSLNDTKQSKAVDAPLKTDSECMLYAKRLVHDEISNTSRVNVSCVGLPDLVPGVGVGFDGIDTMLIGKTYYIESATHTFGSSGYTTSFHAVKG